MFSQVTNSYINMNTNCKTRKHGRRFHLNEKPFVVMIEKVVGVDIEHTASETKINVCIISE